MVIPKIVVHIETLVKVLCKKVVFLKIVVHIETLVKVLCKKVVILKIVVHIETNRILDISDLMITREKNQ